MDACFHTQTQTNITFVKSSMLCWITTRLVRLDSLKLIQKSGWRLAMVVDVKDQVDD